MLSRSCSLISQPELLRNLMRAVATLLLGVFSVLTAAPDADAFQSSQNLERSSSRQLEQRLREIDTELDQLAQFSLRSGIGAIGFRSQTHDTGGNLEWVRIELDGIYNIDEVVIVPSILRRTTTGFSADAFPREFRVVAGVGEDDVGAVIASFSSDDRMLERIAPVVVPCERVQASWVRIEAPVLSRRQFDGKYNFQLSEVLVFSGSRNVALDRPLTVSSDVATGSPGWDKRFMVDGFTPYLMNAATGEESLAYVSAVGIGDEPSLTIDLESDQLVSQILLHLVDQGDTVPQTFSGDFGLPGTLRIEGANLADFSDAILMDEYRHTDDFDAGPILVRQFPETKIRYVRLTAINPYVYSFANIHGTRMGFAEIEVFADSRNVALNKKASAAFDSPTPNRSLAALTDGRNLYGRILPLREWLGQLAQRHELETERPLVAAELNRRYLQQRTNLNRMMWLAILFAAGIFAAILIGRNFRQRAVFETRERIAADLHDELGANLHAIGLLGDLAQAAAASPEKLKERLQRIRALTERTGNAARYCTNMLESKGLYEDPVEDMRRTSRRVLADLEYEISFEGEDALRELKPDKHIDLCLFYKESLINIIRHSGATKVVTEVAANQKNVCLTITDNGHGLPNVPGNEIPPSLKRRAKLLGGQVSARSPEGGGTEIELRLRIKRRFGMFS